jgi:hypothetical protein
MLDGLLAMTDRDRLEAPVGLVADGDRAQVSDQPADPLGRLTEEALVVDPQLGERPRQVGQLGPAGNPLPWWVLLTADRSLAFRGTHSRTRPPASGE